MEILNIGVGEIIIVLLLMFIVLGPKDMVLTAHRVGKWVRGFIRSPLWREILGYSMEIRELPKKIIEETGIEETLKEVKASTQEAVNDVNSSLKEAADAARVPEIEHVRIDATKLPEQENTIQPPAKVETSVSAVSSAPTVDADAQPAGLPADEQPVAAEQSAAVDTTVENTSRYGETAAPTVDEGEAPVTETPSAPVPEVEEGVLPAFPPVPVFAADLEKTEPAALTNDLPPVRDAQLHHGSENGTAKESVVAVPTVVDTTDAPPARKPRRKRAPVEEPAEASTGADSAAVVAEPAQPARKPRRKRAEEPVESMTGLDSPTPVDDPTPPSSEKPVRRPRTRKSQPVAEETQTQAVEGAAASFAAPPEETNASPAVENSTEAAPVRRTRRTAKKYPVEPTAPANEDVTTPANGSHPETQPGQLREGNQE